MISNTAKIRVRYQETDKMGIAYHANYFTWLEVARIELLDYINFPYTELEKQGYFLPVLRCSCSFKKPAKFDDRLSVEVSVQEFRQVRMTLHYIILKDDDCLAEANTTHAFVDSSGSVTRPPKDFVRRIKT
jgi:acyl-CoA thioester hydrolase